MLINAFRLRLDSDYEVSPTLGKTVTEDNLRDAEQFVERAKTYLQQEGHL